jgi:prophage antirepressor-like protein
MEVLPVLAQQNDMRIVEVKDQPVVTARDLARALGYKDELSVHRIYNRNRESFKEQIMFKTNTNQGLVNLTNPLERDPQFGGPFNTGETEKIEKYDTGEVEIDTPGGRQMVRYFTKRGALKICMKSNQPKAIMVQEMLIDLYEAVESRRLIPIEEIAEIRKQMAKLTMEVHKLTAAQEAKIVYLPRRFKPTATDQEAIDFFLQLFEAEPFLRTANAIRALEPMAKKCGWRVGSRASLYRLADKVRMNKLVH